MNEKGQEHSPPEQNQAGAEPAKRRSETSIFLIVLLVMGIAVLMLGVAFFFYKQTQSGKTNQVYHIGILIGFAQLADAADGFKAKMTGLGYIEGKNVIYDIRIPQTDQSDTNAIVEKFIADKADLIFAFPLPTVLIAKKSLEGSNIPLIFTIATIEGNDLVKSVSRPGGNITGVRNPGPELTAKRLELLLEMAPKTKKIWIAYGKNYPPILVTLGALRQAAKTSGVELVELAAESLKDVEAELAARAKSGNIGFDAIIILPDPIMAASENYAIISKFAIEHKIPLAGLTTAQVLQGALFTYFPSEFESGELAAPLADKILKGTSAGTIPVVTPDAKLRINYKVAQELGLTLNEGLLSRAAEVIRE